MKLVGTKFLCLLLDCALKGIYFVEHFVNLPRVVCLILLICRQLRAQVSIVLAKGMHHLAKHDVLLVGVFWQNFVESAISEMHNVLEWGNTDVLVTIRGCI